MDARRALLGRGGKFKAADQCYEWRACFFPAHMDKTVFRRQVSDRTAGAADPLVTGDWPTGGNQCRKLK
jgi:hypothetical protein